MVASFLLALGVLGLLGLVLGVGLGIASRQLAVPVDPRVEQVNAVLPGANCAACGFPGCIHYARGVVGGAAIDLCAVGGQEVADQVAVIMGVAPGMVEKKVAFVRCGGDLTEKRRKGPYAGIQTCAAAAMIAGGPYQCVHGCVGLNDCVRACPFGAITARDGRPPVVDDDRCTACGLCVAACPRSLIALIPATQRFVVACWSRHKGKVVRAVCDVGCIGCGLCAKKCPEHAIVFRNNLARIDGAVCRNHGDCARVCPSQCILEKK